MDFTREEIEHADLVLVVNKDGSYKWSSHRSTMEVTNMLRNISHEIWLGKGRTVKEKGETT